MAIRCLLVRNNVITNIVEFDVPLPLNLNGDLVVPAVTNLEGVGDTFDTTDLQKDRRVTAMEQVIFQELFRLTNEVRILKLQTSITVQQYRTFVRGLM